jgi:hypothetical protein
MPWAEERACRMYPPAEEVEKIDDIADIMHNAVMEIWRLRRRPNAETAAATKPWNRAETREVGRSARRLAQPAPPPGGLFLRRAPCLGPAQ